MSFPLTLAATCVSSRGIFMGTSLSWQEIGVSQPPMEVPMIYKKRTSEVYIHSFVSLMQMRAPPHLQRLAACIDRGVAEGPADHQVIRQHLQEIQRVAATLTHANGSATERQAQFRHLQEAFTGLVTPFYQHVAGVMASFAAGLFVGGDTLPCLQDNVDLERWFRKPKGHERHLHGHRHAGVRIVQEGPTLLLALDAHVTHPEPFTANDLG